MDDAHTPNDDHSARDEKPSSRSLAEALSALMSMAPDATDARRQPVHKPMADAVKACMLIPALTAANSSDEDFMRLASSSDEEARPVRGRGKPANQVTHAPAAQAREGKKMAVAKVPVAKAPVDDELFRESLAYLRKLPNGANLTAALTRRACGLQPQLATLPNPKTRTFYVAPHVSDESERRARLVALVKYKRKREQQKLHPQVRYKSRKKIADSRVRGLPCLLIVDDHWSPLQLHSRRLGLSNDLWCACSRV